MKERTENTKVTTSDSSVDGTAPAPKKSAEVIPTAKAKPTAKKPVASQKAPAKAKPAPKTDDDDDSNDGGVVALSGFLYQILGFTGLKASAELGLDENDHESLELLVRLVREANQIIHEPLGQDMAIEKMRLDGLTGVAFIQFKFSRLAKQIPPKELGEIATRMAEARGCHELGVR